MRKILFYSLLFVALFSSCKKEKEGGDPHASTLTMHYSYVKGFVFDSVTGTPLPGALIYQSESPFASGFVNTGSVDTTDVNGAYTRRIFWLEGYSLSTGSTARPNDAINIYMNSFTTSESNFGQLTWGDLVEDDTINLPTIMAKPYAYVTTHVKEVLPVSSGIYLYWYHAVGVLSVLYPANSDTVVTRQICPNLKTYLYWSGSGSDSVIVNSGDTTFVNVFY